MKAAPRFLIRFLIASVAFFSMVQLLEPTYAWLVSQGSTIFRGMISLGSATVTEANNLSLVVPVVAALTAASGLANRGKIRSIAYAFAAFLAFDIATVSFEVVRIAEEVRAGAPNLSFIEQSVGILYHGLVWALPFVLLGMFLGWRFETLWSTPKMKKVRNPKAKASRKKRKRR